jgi:hypothetical protein
MKPSSPLFGNVFSWALIRQGSDVSTGVPGQWIGLTGAGTFGPHLLAAARQGCAETSRPMTSSGIPRRKFKSDFAGFLDHQERLEGTACF